MFQWNYFEPRELFPNTNIFVVACKLNEDKSASYWKTDEVSGLLPINVSWSEEKGVIIE